MRNKIFWDLHSHRYTVFCSQLKILVSSNMATKVLKEYTLEEISQVFFQFFDLPVMFKRNNGSIAKKATL
jgi:hypothetical protein